MYGITSISLTCYIPEIITGGATILAGVVISIIGVWGYYRQKEYDLIKQRYLEEGLDVITSTAQHVLNVFQHNWARVLEILKSFRDMPEEFDISEFDKGFIDLTETRFPIIAQYRVGSVVKSQIIWNVFQLVISFAQNGISVIKNEIPQTIKLKITTDRIQASPEELVNEAMSHLKELNEESYLYYNFISELQKIIELIETQKFRMKKLQKIHNHEIVKTALNQLQTKFDDKLKPHKEDSK